jgi:type II secretory pathway pseudopilin PulG
MRQPRRGRRSESGLILIGVLVMLALAALFAVQTGQRLADSRQRDNEEELLHIGEQYRAAIESYWRLSPATARALPSRLQDLVEDNRFPQPRRHLRKLYADPLAPESPWGIVKQGNAVIGVYSQADGVPFRQTGFSEAQRGFDNAGSYSDWRFSANVVPKPGTGQASAATAGARR